MAFDTYILFPDLTGIAGEAGFKNEKGGFETLEAFLSKDNKLDLDGKQSKYPIQLTSFGFGAVQPVTVARSDVGGATTGRSKYNNFTAEANADNSTVAIAYHAAAGTVFSRVDVFSFFTAASDGSDGGTSKPVLAWHIGLAKAVLSTTSVTVGGGDDLPTFSFELNIGAAFLKRWTISPEGKATDHQEFGWHALKNIEIATFGDLVK
jgi:hypothetical protein